MRKSSKISSNLELMLIAAIELNMETNDLDLTETESLSLFIDKYKFILDSLIIENVKNGRL